MKKLLLLLAFFAFATAGFSQSADRKWNIGLHGGLQQFNGDIGYGWYRSSQPYYGVGALTLSRYISDAFDIFAMGSYGEIGFVKDNTNKFRARLSTATINFRVNFTPPHTAVRPYLYAGAGLLMFAPVYSVKKSVTDFAFPSAGGGINFRLSDVVSFQLQEAFMYSTSDKIDGIEHGNNDAFLLHTAGLTFNLGKAKDEDKDGVADKRDACLGTPPGVAVDVKGCPLDRDADGIADYIDDCPDAAGLAAFKGCPDKDADGVADKDDRCPDAKGSAELKGCPDADADGVADIDDKCPDTKAGYKVDATGCTMDNDKDGLVNEDDRCPDAAGIASLKGCPDKDGDGVADIDDRCPDTKGTLANKGCPEMKVEDVKKITQIASKIFFETASDKLKVASLVQLDELAEILGRYPEARLTIEGHTDDVGKDDYNMNLSQKRTESVKKYLIGKGIVESRLTAIGYGETKPIADNTKSDGRAENRRVELKTEY